MDKFGMEMVANWFQADKQRLKLAAVLGICGVVLLFVRAPSETKNENTSQPAVHADYEKKLEQRLEELICQVEGAGKTVVMVSLETGTQNVYAHNIEETANGGYEETHILLDEGGALTETVQTPQIGGVAVVCEGGSDITVISKITEILSSLLGLSSKRISVAKMS